MGLFSWGKKKARVVALIDIGSSSVGGAYVYVVDGEKPIIYYTARVDVEVREEEDIRDSMMRSLTFLERLLIEEGAPALRRETGSAAIDHVLVSVSAPWQESIVSITQFNTGKSFIFTHRHLAEAERRVPKLKQGRTLSGQSVIASILNGYDTKHPYGRYVARAEIVLLTSTLEKEATHQIETSLRRTFHTHDLHITAFAPIVYEVFKNLYPHQEDFIVLDVSGSGTDMVMVKRGLLSAVVAIPLGTHELCSKVRAAGARTHIDSDALIPEPVNEEFEKACEEIQKGWIASLHAAFLRFSTKEALPRTIFLLADAEVRPYIKRILDERELKSLWLMDEPLSIIALEPAHLTPHVKTRGQGTGDLYMALLALFAARTEEK
jgi:hypothetical protein